MDQKDEKGISWIACYKRPPTIGSTQGCPQIGLARPVEPVQLAKRKIRVYFAPGSTIGSNPVQSGLNRFSWQSGKSGFTAPGSTVGWNRSKSLEPIGTGSWPALVQHNYRSKTGNDATCFSFFFILFQITGQWQVGRWTVLCMNQSIVAWCAYLSVMYRRPEQGSSHLLYLLYKSIQRSRWVRVPVAAGGVISRKPAYFLRALSPWRIPYKQMGMFTGY